MVFDRTLSLVTVLVFIFGAGWQSIAQTTVTGKTSVRSPVNLPVQKPGAKRIVGVKIVTPLDEKLEDILPVNVNSTDAATLMKVPGISRTAARQIVNHRDRNGKYTDLQQLVGFSGIGKANISRISKYLVLE